MIKLIEQNGNIDLTAPIVYKNPVKPYIDTSKITNWAYMFQQGRREEWDIANTDFSNGVNFGRCFHLADFTGEIILDSPKASNYEYAFNSSNFDKIKINVAGATTLSNVFYDAGSTKEIEFLSETKHITNFSACFRGCKNLKSIKGLDLSGVFQAYAITNMFNLCAKLEECVITGTLKIYSNNFKISGSPKLTRESVLSFANAIENGGTTTYTLYFGAENLAKLTEEEKAELIAKNFILA